MTALKDPVSSMTVTEQSTPSATSARRRCLASDPIGTEWRLCTLLEASVYAGVQTPSPCQRSLNFRLADREC